jgi:N-methylhydantoinase A
MALRVGVDSGGTFTDVCVFDEESGQIGIWKVSSTPADPSVGIVESVEQGIGRSGRSAADIGFFGHGTTVGTNALLQHRGVRTGLITTRGFRDLLEIGRQKRPDLYDLQADKPEPIVPRDLRLEVGERVLFDGRVETPLDEDEVRRAARRLKAAGVEAVAICFLYGFAYPEHEARARRIVAEEIPDAFVCASHEVAPEFREYERLSSTVVNAYLGPVMEGYIARLGRRLVELGVGAPLHLTQSNGGVLGFATAARLAVRTLLSGPSTGVVAAQAVGRAAGFDDLITFDMGGTSTDVALLTGGACALASDADIEGYPIKAPMLDIHTVGAGGGSIAVVDGGGLLKVGPRSAGADPGPAAYGRGNREPTVTDANVVLRTLNPEHLLDGRMPIDRDLALAAVGRTATELGLDPTATALGILSVVTANMAKAIRVISVQRGHDPRDYTLMAFGGAGPLHAARLARELEIRRVLIPRAPGTLCALGLLLTDLRADFARSRQMPFAPGAAAEASATFAELEDRAVAWFDAEAIAPERRLLNRVADMRYCGQNYEIGVPVPLGALDAEALARVGAAFAAAHARLYGFVADADPVEIVTFRVEAIGLVEKAAFAPEPDAGADAAPAIAGWRDVWLADGAGPVRCPIYRREALRPGNVFAGPAIVEQMDTTAVVLPDMTARVDPYLNLILEFAP